MAYQSQYLPAGGKIPLDLLLSVVEYPTPNGKQKRGLCSNFLANVEIGQRIAVNLKSSPTFHFKQSDDGKIPPTLMVGAGSGLAPFRGFWQTMALSSISNQEPSQEMPVQLVFGCKKVNGNILDNETKALAGILERC